MVLHLPIFQVFQEKITFLWPSCRIEGRNHTETIHPSIPFHVPQEFALPKRTARGQLDTFRVGCWLPSNGKCCVGNATELDNVMNVKNFHDGARAHG